MERVTGVGGIFFRAKDPKALADWYRAALGIEPRGDGYVWFDWYEHAPPHAPAITAWSLFARDSDYFDPAGAPAPSPRQQAMVNYRVRDLDAMLAQLKVAGARVDAKIEDGEFGRFGWATDPDGNRFELWEPPASIPGVPQSKPLEEQFAPRKGKADAKRKATAKGKAKGKGHSANQRPRR